MKITTVALVLVAGTAFAQYDPNSNPNSYKNNEFSYENSPFNYKNSPYNYENSEYKYNNPRIIHDEDGKASGYIVPKDSGGSNLFDMKGNRKGWISDDNR